MPRKRKDVAPVDEIAGEAPALELQPSPNPTETPTEPKAPRLGAYIPLTADGHIDRKRIRPTQEESVNRAIAAIRADSAGTPGAVTGDVQFITDSHIKFLLDGYGTVCAHVIPGVINSKLRKVGAPTISHELAVRVYQFTPEQIESLTPDGVAFFNQQFALLPQWMKDWILAVGPGTKFFGQLGFITYMNTQKLIAEFKAMQPVAAAPEAKPNGVDVQDAKPENVQ